MAYAFVQIKEGTGAASATTIASGNLTSNPTSGNLLFVAVMYGNDPAQSITVADTLGNTFTEIGSGFWNAGTGIRWFYAKNITGGSADSVTATIAAASTNRGICVIEYSGLDVTAPFTSGETGNQSEASPGTGADAINSPSTPTLAAQPALVVGFTLELGGSSTMAEGTGYTLRDNNVWTALGLEACVEDKRVTATTAVQSTFTDATNGGVDTYISFVAVFREPAGPAIDVQPQSVSVYRGQTANFTISATTSGGALSYQWKDDGVNVGTDSNSYTTNATVDSDNGSLITCVVTDSNGSTTSNAAVLTVLMVANLAWTRA